MTTRRCAGYMAVVVAAVVTIVGCSRRDEGDVRYQEFTRLAKGGSRAEALELGATLFQEIAVREPNHPVYTLMRERLDAARQLRDLILASARPRPADLLEGIAGMEDLGLAPPSSGSGKPATLRPTGAELYWSHMRIFSRDWPDRDLPAQEMTFLHQYHDLQMQDPIMEIGRQMMVLDPNSPENACCALVLPLLSLYGRDGQWGQMKPLLTLFSPEMVDVSSDFALLQVERPEAALALARFRAEATGQTFSPGRWALAAADACVTNHRPDVADKLLAGVVANMSDADAAAQLRLKIADGYATCGDCIGAAQVCKRILSESPSQDTYGKVMAAYLGYLAREQQADQVIAATDEVLDDTRCRTYMAQILYLRWWALCKVDRQDEAVQLADRLIEQFPKNSCVAPVLLERATDALAHQQYDRSRELLSALAADFPNTESAKRAQDVLTRLKGNGIN